MVACHCCPDHRLWDEKDIVYFLWNGGTTTTTEEGFLRIAPSVTKERVEGSYPVCPDCLKNLLND